MMNPSPKPSPPLSTGASPSGGSPFWSPRDQSSPVYRTVAGAPPPAPSSGASVRRNHTISSAGGRLARLEEREKIRLDEHFEQPEPAQPPSSRYRHSPSSPSNRAEEPSSEYTHNFAPLQALYSKSAVSRNNSLPSRHSTSRPSLGLQAAPPLPSPRSPVSSNPTTRASLHNSLSAITGGSDNDEHEWESMIRTGGPLGDEQWSTSVFDHRRFPSQPTSTQSRSPDVPSPVGTGNYSAGAHHRSGSAASASELDKGAFASSPLNSGFVRRHQSLNHHSGRQMASRLASRSQELSGHSNVEPTSPSIGSHMEYAYRTNAHNGSGSPSAPSPISPSFASAPWNQHGEGITANITSPSRFANAFPSESRAAPGGAYRERGSSLSSNSHSLMDIHSNLARMDINTSILPVRGDSTDSGSTVTPTSAVGGPHSSLPSRPGLGSRNSASDVPRLSPNPPSARKLPSLITNRDVLARSAAGGGANIFGGPASAAAFVPPIGHAHTRQQSSDSPLAFMPRDPKAAALTAKRAEETDAFMGPFSAHAAPGWTQREMIVGRNEPGSPRGPGQHPELGLSWGLGLSPSTANLDKGNMNSLALSMAQAQQHRTAMLQAQAGMSPNGNAMLGMGANTGSPGPNRGGGGETSSNNSNFSLATPVDFSSLAAQKGYNPLAFDLSPPFARYFVIKSYTEDDVHKSLKYEIWASTEKGNQRLDRAWRESAGRGPIYLFFSVNASGHFCGMAQMLTPVDMSTSANVWAQDGKWKGTFKVRWIYVKDLPNNQLRHIRLTNTPEVKPVTQSRDTQELTAAAGTEVLRIMAEYPAKTSLLQDFSFYELQSRQQAAQRSQTAAAQTHPGVVGPPVGAVAPPLAVGGRPRLGPSPL